MRNTNRLTMSNMLTARQIALVSSGVLLFIPLIAGAQTIEATLGLASNILNAVIGLFITLAIVVFFWGLIKYLWSMGSEDAHEGIKIMFWGVIAIFVMVSIWGIIALLQRSLRVQGGQAIVPQGIHYDPR